MLAPIIDNVLATAVFLGQAPALAHVVPWSCPAPRVSVAVARSVVAVLVALVPIVIAGLLLAAPIVIPVAALMAVVALFMAVVATIMAIIVLGERGGSCQQAHCHQSRKKGFGVHANSL